MAATGEARVSLFMSSMVSNFSASSSSASSSSAITNMIPPNNEPESSVSQYQLVTQLVEAARELLMGRGVASDTTLRNKNSTVVLRTWLIKEMERMDLDMLTDFLGSTMGFTGEERYRLLYTVDPHERAHLLLEWIAVRRQQQQQQQRLLSSMDKFVVAAGSTDEGSVCAQK